MKRLLLIISIIFLSTSCKGTYYVTPEEDYIQFVKEAHQEVLDRGYKFAGCSCDTVLLERYDWGGYTLSNDRVFVSSYLFTDSIGDSVEYSIAVNYRCSDIGNLYIDSANVAYCNVTKEADKDLCTSNQFMKLANPPKRQMRWWTEEGALGLVLGVPAAFISSFFIYMALNNHK